MHEALAEEYLKRCKAFEATMSDCAAAPASAEQLAWALAEIGRQRDAGRDVMLAERLLKIAARKSCEVVQGWAHPDCADLAEAARLLKGEPRQPIPSIVEGVLS